MHYSGRKVLVTGADGFIGSHLTEKLIACGAEVTALSLYSSFDNLGWLDDLPDAARQEMTAIRGDIRDSAFVRRIAKGQDIIFHLAALIAIPYSYTAPQSYAETNILGTLNVLEAARDGGVGRVVHTSTSEVYGTALTTPITEEHPLQGQSPYSASKVGADMMAEAFARSFDLPVTILRPFNTFGPRQSERAVIPAIIRQALDPNCRVIMIGDVTPLRDFTFVEDTADAFLALGIAPKIRFGCPYNAGSGKAVTVKDVIDLVLDLTDCDKPVKHDPKRMRPAASEVRALLADSSRLREHAGWRPAFDFREGLNQTVAWWRRRLAEKAVRREKTFMI